MLYNIVLMMSDQMNSAALTSTGLEGKLLRVFPTP